MFPKCEFSNSLVKVSLFAGIVYYITAYPIVFEKARKYFPVKFKNTHHLLIFHTFVFAILMYVLTYFVFDPIVRVVEGTKNNGEDEHTITVEQCAGINNAILDYDSMYSLNTVDCSIFQGDKKIPRRTFVCEGGWEPTFSCNSSYTEFSLD